jgi:hypothetical protein
MSRPEEVRLAVGHLKTAGAHLGGEPLALLAYDADALGQGVRAASQGLKRPTL